MIDEQLKGKEDEYSVQIYEVSAGELYFKVVYKDQTRHIYAEFEENDDA